MSANVFYSWQSDLPNGTNRSFILEALEGAAKDVKQDGEIAVEPVIDRDTAGVAGSPDIGSTILAKIDAAAAFVCDVSLLTMEATGRPTPNPNVLVELGYAMKALGQRKIVMVMNTAFGPPEKLPFDLRQKRVATYHLPEGASKNQVRQDLRRTLGAAIKAILREHQQEGRRDEPARVGERDVAKEAPGRASFWTMDLVRRISEHTEAALLSGNAQAADEGPLLRIATPDGPLEGNVVFVRQNERMGRLLPDPNARDGIRVRTVDGGEEYVPMIAVSGIRSIY